MKPELKAIAAQVAKMTDAERAAIAARYPVITIAEHVISARNTVLITMQTADPVTIVGGFRQWIAAGRCVKKGEKALYILKPCSKKADPSGPQRTPRGARPRPGVQDLAPNGQGR